MQVPAAMFVESALDGMKSVPLKVLADQVQELRTAMGQATCDRLNVSYPLSPDFVSAYNLGLQVARVMIQGSVKLAMSNINPEEVL